MKVEEFEAATENDLRRLANECFAKAESAGGLDRPWLLLSAQFYLDEIERRDDRFRSKRDFWLEVIIIIGIAIEVGFSYIGFTEGSRQLDALNEAKKALQITADTLKSSAKDFRDTAEAAKGQFTFLQTEKQNRDEAVFSTLYKELSFNDVAVAENKTALETELAAIRKEGGTLIDPINTLHTDAWELLRLYLPHQISGNSRVLGSVTEIYRLTQRANELIRSREDYRNHNGAMLNFTTRMAASDQRLQELNAMISLHLKELLPILKVMQKAGAQQAAPENPAKKKPLARCDGPPDCARSARDPGT